MSTSVFNINNQLEHLQAKFVGTGHADTNRYEWLSNIHRDSLASYLGHPTLLAYFSVAENESIGRTKLKLMEKMVRPCGPPLNKIED